MTSTTYMESRHPKTPSPRLPWELTDTIIDFLYADATYDASSAQALSACSTVCSQFLLRSRFHAFATVQLWPWRAQRFFELVASPGCTFARVMRRIEVDDRARRLGGRMVTRGSSSSRIRTLGGRSGSGSGKRSSVERSGSRSRAKAEDGQQEGDTDYMRFVDIMALAQHHLPLLNISLTSLSISNVDWTALRATQTALLRTHVATAFPSLRALELHGATFHDMREFGRVVEVFEQLGKMRAKGTVFLKYPEHVMEGAQDIVLGRPGVLKTVDLGRDPSILGDGLEVPAVLASVVDGLVELTVRGLRKAHAAHVQSVFCEKGKALKSVHLSAAEDPDAILSALDLSTLSSLRTLAIHGLQPASLASSALPALLKRVEASFFDTIELGLCLDGLSVLPQLDCSALQKVLLEHQFFGLSTVRIVVDRDAVSGEQSVEGWIMVALPQLQGVMEIPPMLWCPTRRSLRLLLVENILRVRCTFSIFFIIVSLRSPAEPSLPPLRAIFRKAAHAIGGHFLKHTQIGQPHAVYKRCSEPQICESSCRHTGGLRAPRPLQLVHPVEKEKFAEVVDLDAYVNVVADAEVEKQYWDWHAERHMAIHAVALYLVDEVPFLTVNFEAWIGVDGRKLECHAVDIDRYAKETSCWVASEEDKTFSVFLRIDDPKYHCHAKLTLDGKMSSTYLHKRERQTPLEFRDLSTSKSTRRAFKFAPLDVTGATDTFFNIFILRVSDRGADDPQCMEAGLQDASARIGEVKLEIRRISGLKYITQQASSIEHGDSDAESIPNGVKVHESSLKASLVPHQISLGEKIQVVSKAGHKKHIYTKKEVVATFVFRYRPLRVLVDAGIVHHNVVPSSGIISDRHANDAPEPGTSRTGISQPSLERSSSPPPGPTQTTNHDPGARNALAENGAADEDSDSDIYVRSDIESQIAANALSPRPLGMGTDGGSGVNSELKRNPINNASVEYHKGGASESIKDETDDDKKEVDLLSEPDDQERELMAQLEKYRAQKRKGREDVAASRKKIKAEPDQKFYFTPGEVIDLT
ncbi:hypothetical protein D9619_004000 [Psilocybe cf. subviscida]|uniref:DUF7918 domain-containing protein n=1 Tax=Psilocybe cf. subviscida TaxID=2480587 RepID=A0A8H5BNU7_9AGAR|nr:hypothetical protein D9619_004000 [Psilocybe cf. subviscida]